MIEGNEGMAWWMLGLAVVIILAIFGGALRWVNGMKEQNADFRFRQLFTRWRKQHPRDDSR